MLRMLLALLLGATLTGVRAQKDSSLTKEFERMSAKERARVAKQEEVGAAKDSGFQAAMAEAETLFKQQQYDAALEKYQAARRLRPLNVHPKVKIQDLQALIKRREEARAKEIPLVPAPSIPVLPERTEVLDAAQPSGPAITSSEQPVKETATKPVLAPSRPRQAVAAPVRTSNSLSSSPAHKSPDGVNERMYMEGRAVVIERVLTVDGRSEVYRKVTHPWGAVNYFRDGSPVPERVWNASGAAR